MFDSAGTHVFSAGDDGKLLCTNVFDGVVEKEIASLANAINSIAVHPRLNVVATASDNELVQIWSADSEKALQTLDGHSANVTKVVFSSDGRLMASTDENGLAIVWQIHSREGHFSAEQLAMLNCHNRSITGVNFSPDQRRLATISLDGTAALWDLDTFQEAIRLKPLGESNHYYSIEFSPDGKTLFGALAEKMTIWDSAPAGTVRSKGIPDRNELVQWHHQELDICRGYKNWFGVVFHANKLLELQSDEPNHYLDRGIAYANQYKLRAAVKDLDTARKMGCEDARLFANLAAIRLQQEDFSGFSETVQELVWRAKKTTNPRGLRMALLGLELVTDTLKTTILELADTMSVDTPLAAYRRSQFGHVQSSTQSFQESPVSPSLVSNGLLQSLSLLQLGQQSQSKHAFEAAVWKWEQILASDRRESQPTLCEKAIVERLIQEALALFASKDVAFGETAWSNCTPVQRTKIGGLLNDLGDQARNVDLEQWIASLHLLVAAPEDASTEESHAE